MSAQWRLFLLALRYFTRIPVPASVLAGKASFDAAARYLPLVGVVVGAAGGAVYWLSAQLWPTSLAVILSMLCAVLITGAIHEAGLVATCALLGNSLPRERALDAADSGRRSGFGGLGLLLVLLTKYNALMALSAARLPLATTPFVALGLIMLAGHAVSRALAVSVIATPAAPPAGAAAAAPRPHISATDLVVALGIGFSPAILLGLPGLIGLAAALLVRMLFVVGVRPQLGAHPGDFFGATQQLTEVAYYLGALAAWTYI